MITGEDKIKIVINGRFLTQPATGVQRYALELVRAWDVMLEKGEIDPEHYELELVTPHLSESIHQYRHIPLRQVGFLQGNLWEQIELPWHTRGEFLFNPCNVGPVLKVNQAVTMHDASVFAVPQSYSLPFRMKYRLILSILAQTAKVVLTVSEFSKLELQKYCHVPSNKIFVIYEGCDHMGRILPDTSILKRNNIGDKPFIFAVGSDAIHKNLSILGEVSTILDSKVDIIITGGEYMPWFKTVPNGTIGEVKRLGYITDEELKALYQHATAFIFPSIYEGFGLPPLEAMTCGCPVICSRIASLEEVCGDAVLYFDPINIKEIKNQINDLILNPALLSSLKQRGVNQVKQYTWHEAARNLMKILISKGLLIK
jgi:glycosyltransferase involved in cell wall biosynthesis